jgi:hypothetical protein
MPQPTPPSPHPVHANEAGDPLDRRIASLRDAVEGDSHGGASRNGVVLRREPERPDRHPSILRQGSWVIHARRFEIRVYAFCVAISLLAAYLIASHLKL